MATDEAVRYRLHQKLDDLVGADEATLLMSGLSPVPWTDLATKRDIDELGTVVRSELREVRGEVLERIGALDAKIGELDARLSGQIGALDARLSRQIGELDARLSGQIGALDAKIGELDARLSAQIGALDAKIGAVEGRLGALRAQVFVASFVSSFTTAGLVLAVVRLA